MSNLLENDKQKSVEQSVNQNVEKSEEVALRRLSSADMPITQNKEEANDNTQVKIDMPIADFRTLDMSAFQTKDARSIDTNLNKINYEISGTSIKDNPYGNFKERVDRKARDKAINNKRSRLYQKHKNANLLNKAINSMDDSRKLLRRNVNECIKKFTENERQIMAANINIEDYITLLGGDQPNMVANILKSNLTDEKSEDSLIENLIDNFLEMQINMDLSSDKIIAENAANYENQKARYMAYRALLPKIDRENPTISPEKLLAFNHKLEDFGKLIGYYDAKCRLITNEYYMEHYDDELGLYYGERAGEDQEDKQRNAVSSLIMEEQAWKLIIDGKNAVFFEAFNEIKNTEEQKACILATNMIAYQINNMNQVNYNRDLLYSKPLESKFLKFISAFKRESYTASHGRKNYEKSLNNLKFIPEKLQHLNDKNAKPFMYKHYDNAPEIDITKLYKDNYKSELKTMYEKILKLSIKDKNPGEYEKLLQAMDAYLKTNGIVNKDTVEMEMAFLDQFLVSSKTWLESNESDKDSEDYINIKAIRDKIVSYSQGSLKDNMSDDEFEFVKEHAITVREYIGQHKGGTASNIKDIPLFLHQPNMNDVKQSTIGDCWFMSAVTSVVKMSPDFIRSMFYDLDDGRVMVRLYDMKNKRGYRQHEPDLILKGTEFSPVYVILDKQYETGLGNAADCPWLQLLERAYAACGFNHAVTSFEKTEIGKQNMHHMIDEMTSGEVYLGVGHMIGKTVYKDEIKRSKRAKRPEKMEKNERIRSWYAQDAGIAENELDPNVNYKNYDANTLKTFKKVKKVIDDGGVVPCLIGGHALDILDTKVHNGRLMVLIRDPFNIYHHKYSDNIYKKPDSAGLGTVILKYLGYRTLRKDKNTDGNIRQGFLGTSWWDMDEVMNEMLHIVPVTKDMFENPNT